MCFAGKHSPISATRQPYFSQRLVWFLKPNSFLWVERVNERGTEPSFGSGPRRSVGGGRRGVVDDASEEEGDSQGDFNGTKSSE
ncbi:unnamed protein product [Arctogadus glacialis]